MPSKYPICKYEEVEKAFQKPGFWSASQNGSHVKYTNGKRITIIPKHYEIAKGTLKGILEKADISLDDFMDALKK
ncbi:MAG: type II toxin-antitoxin system HicA family toxin [Lachnospiraceae bacterium]|nr:type II toxin-antitoxin system HicA family toxin [Lachnospiraceae bacterium]